MLEDYLARDWDAAETRLQAMKARASNKLYDVYLERIGHFRADPPPADWDGVYTYTSK
jgi:adenylate cyclase